jgi:hypothetical protein
MRLAALLLWSVATSQPVASQEPGIVGRWDLTFEDDRGKFPGWLEVIRSAGVLAGRMQGRFGHATPIGPIELDGERFRFRWPSESNPGAKPTELSGRVEGDRLAGSMTAPSGGRTAFTGLRAPALAPPARVEWGEPIDLLAGGLEGWRPRAAERGNGWSYTGGVLTNLPPSVDLISRRHFTNFKLHVEVSVPPNGNSGIYLRGRHEIQVQDDFGKEPHNRRMGGVYGQVTPTSLPAKPAGEWQSFDITLLGRQLTVVLNGVTVVDRQEIPGITGGALDSDEASPGPIMLQGDHTGIRYRNIVITPARED